MSAKNVAPTSAKNTSTQETSVVWQREQPQALKRRLLWLMGARLLIGTLLMGGTVVFQLKSLEHPAHPTENIVFWLVGATYFLTLLYSLLFPRFRNLYFFTTLQLSLDLLLISLLVLATGVHESIFLFLYLLVVIGAAVLLYRRWAFLFALGSLTLFALLLSMTMIDFFRSWPVPDNVVALKLPEFFYVLTVYGMAFFLTAFLSSHLAEQLRHTGEMLKKQQIDFDNLEALHQDIVRSLTSGLITADLQGRIQFFNRSACEQTGLMWPSLFGKSLVEIFPELGSFLKRVEAGEKKFFRLEIPFRRPDGEPRLFGCSLSPLHNRHKRQNGVLLLFQDLTPLKVMEERARNREKMAALGEMAAGLAHEIRNPLSSLSGSIQLLRTELELPEEHRALMNIVLRETDRLNLLLGDFLMFARPKKLRKESQSLARVLRESLHLFSQDQRYSAVEVSLDVPEDVSIDIDGQLFHQIIWNLLLNAAQAMLPEGGTIVVEGEQTNDGTWVKIADSGGGIPASLKDRIFEPFFSTRDHGSGLGLAVVQRIVAEHGGQIELEDVEPQGSRFCLFFPNENATYHVEEQRLSSLSIPELYQAGANVLEGSSTPEHSHSSTAQGESEHEEGELFWGRY